MKEAIDMKSHEKTSARLRISERIAELSGFKYDVKRYPYGGFFTQLQLEKIEEKLKELKKIDDEHTHPDDRR